MFVTFHILQESFISPSFSYLHIHRPSPPFASVHRRSLQPFHPVHHHSPLFTTIPHHSPPFPIIHHHSPSFTTIPHRSPPFPIIHHHTGCSQIHQSSLKILLIKHGRSLIRFLEEKLVLVFTLRYFPKYISPLSWQNKKGKKELYANKPSMSDVAAVEKLLDLMSPDRVPIALPIYNDFGCTIDGLVCGDGDGGLEMSGGDDDRNNDSGDKDGNDDGGDGDGVFR
nr:FAR1 DNA binding domain-containing protein [Tanacetum cinerariifolium]